MNRRRRRGLGWRFQQDVRRKQGHDDEDRGESRPMIAVAVHISEGPLPLALLAGDPHVIGASQIRHVDLGAGDLLEVARRHDCLDVRPDRDLRRAFPGRRDGERLASRWWLLRAGGSPGAGQHATEADDQRPRAAGHREVARAPSVTSHSTVPPVGSGAVTSTVSTRERAAESGTASQAARFAYQFSRQSPFARNPHLRGRSASKEPDPWPHDLRVS